MSLVSSKDIKEPKIKVSPPAVVIWIFGLAMALVVIAVIYLPVGNTLIKTLLLSAIILIAFGIARNQRKGNYLVTMQANDDGLYFQTDDYSKYFYVPWRNTGVMEKAVFPLNSRGLRIEVTGEWIEYVQGTKQIGNVMTENGRTFIYTIPQLQDRDKLINNLLKIRKSSLER